MLTDSTPVAGKTIEFFHRVSGATEWTSVGTAVTDQNGVAVKVVTLVVPQTYDFRAYFAGDEDYEPAEAYALNVRIKAKTTLTISVTPL